MHIDNKHLIIGDLISALAKIKQEPMDDSDDCQHRSTSRKANTGRKSANAEFSDPDDDSEKESDDEDLDVPKGTKPGRQKWGNGVCFSAAILQNFSKFFVFSFS